MLVSKEQFEEFQQEFLRWVDIFGLKQYRVMFYLQKLNGAHAEIRVQEQDKVVSVFLGNHTVKRDPLDVVRTAKHEAIHLLLWRMEFLGLERFTASDEIGDECEGLVRRLEKCL